VAQDDALIDMRSEMNQIKLAQAQEVLDRRESGLQGTAAPGGWEGLGESGRRGGGGEGGGGGAAFTK
jgi:hypothetical protein